MKKNNSIAHQIADEKELLQELIEDYSKLKQTDLLSVKNNEITKENFMESVKNYAFEMYDVTSEIVEKTLKMFENYVFGYSILTDLINDPQVSDIRVTGYNQIRIKRKGHREDAGIVFSSKEEYARFVDFVATRNQVSLSNLNAIQRFTDDESNPDYILRFTISIPLVNTFDEPYLVIRKVAKNFPTIDKLVNMEEPMLSQELADVLVSRFTNGSTLVCGGNSSGKTTILNALKEEIPHDVSVLIAQQADELTTKTHPDMMFMHSLPNSEESKVKYDLKNISIAGLTMDVDFFIIGEIKGEEARYLLNAAYTGQLCAATIHAPSAPKALDKLIDYSLIDSKYSKDELLRMMDCFKTIIFMKNYRVCQVYAVKWYNRDKGELEYEAIWENGGFVNGYDKNNAGEIKY